jgi:hypothetical protein
MKTTRIFLGLCMLCGTAFGTPAPIITTTPTNGPTTVTVHARTTDGKLPADVSCTGSPMYYTISAIGPREPSFVGSNGDWTATNVTPGDYKVSLRSPNYAEENREFFVKAGTNYSIDFVLSRGATFKGRVLDAATGKPIADQPIYAFPSTRDPLRDIRTDAEGRYELPPVAGALELDVETTNYVAQVVKLDPAAEDSTVSVSDIRLQHGGWISGRVERSAELESNAIAWVTLAFQGTLPTNSVILDFGGTDGTFRTDPLPPGTYTLHAEWDKTQAVFLFAKSVKRRAKSGPPQDPLASGSISGIQVTAGIETTNVVIPTKMIVPASDRSGR